MDPVFEDVETRAAGEGHVYSGVVMAEDEMVHIVSLLELGRELIERFVGTLEFIFPVVRQTAVTGPCVAEAVGEPWVKHAEQNLQETAMEDAADDPVSERHIPQSVTMTETEFHAGNINHTRLFEAFHAELLEVAVGPDVVVSGEEIHIHTTVHELLQGSENPYISFRNDITVLIPEIPNVAEEVDRRGVFRQGTQEVGETALACGGVGHLKAQMDV